MEDAGGEDALMRGDARATRRTLSGHPDEVPPAELALRALREALVALVSEPAQREYLQTEHPAIYEQLDEAMRFATGLRAVEHAAAERDRRLVAPAARPFPIPSHPSRGPGWAPGGCVGVSSMPAIDRCVDASVALVQNRARKCSAGASPVRHGGSLPAEVGATRAEVRPHGGEKPVSMGRGEPPVRDSGRIWPRVRVAAGLVEVTHAELGLELAQARQGVVPFLPSQPGPIEHGVEASRVALPDLAAEVAEGQLPEVIEREIEVIHQDLGRPHRLGGQLQGQQRVGDGIAEPARGEQSGGRRLLLLRLARHARQASASELTHCLLP
jgi:hypothetical protein